MGTEGWQQVERAGSPDRGDSEPCLTGVEKVHTSGVAPPSSRGPVAELSGVTAPVYSSSEPHHSSSPLEAAPSSSLSGSGSPVRGRRGPGGALTHCTMGISGGRPDGVACHTHHPRQEGSVTVQIVARTRALVGFRALLVFRSLWAVIGGSSTGSGVPSAAWLTVRFMFPSPISGACHSSSLPHHS
jgi:hypothetical protein